MTYSFCRPSALPTASKVIAIGLIKLFILLYADNVVIFSSDAEGLQKGLNVRIILQEIET